MLFYSCENKYQQNWEEYIELLFDAERPKVNNWSNTLSCLVIHFSEREVNVCEIESS